MLNRYHLDAALEPGTSVVLEGDEHHHAVRVHRVREGEGVELFDGRGIAVLARIESIGPRSLGLSIESRIVEPREPRLELELAVALIHPDRLELVLQKATEIGVASFQPITTSRTEVRPERVLGRSERWAKIVLEAVKQSGRSVIPRLEPVIPLEQALARPGVNVILDPSGESSPPPAASVRLFVGPEGGWSEEELDAARRMGAHSWSLGHRRLRAETAAIAGAALLLLHE
ncbi:MAG TPA: RsmE family RNA methyltransferase [Thermoanaerobaculia bacterium]|nr:RsmE family RNA methyltransferase [Thermoanaerobaculia bacterium]